jgi:hypothetical protein
MYFGFTLELPELFSQGVLRHMIEQSLWGQKF